MSEKPDVRLKGWKPQKLNASYAKDASWSKGLRDWVEYRDLGIGDATGGQIHAHVIRIKTDSGLSITQRPACTGTSATSR